MFNFRLDRVNFDEELGAGASSTVYPYQKNPQDLKWVVKCLVTRDIQKVFKGVQEVVLGFSSNNPHVLPVKGYHLDYDKINKNWMIYMKLPRMEGSLRKIIDESQKAKKSIPEEKIVRYLYDVTQGLQYLHERKIAHRDIKPDNILLDEHGRVQIADFGISNFSNESTAYKLTVRAGTPLYAAPENLDLMNEHIKNKDLFRADLWSLGMLALDLCVLDLRSLDFSSLPGDKKEAYLADRIQDLEGVYSRKLLDVIAGLLQHDPKKRKSLKDIERELQSRYPTVLVRIRMLFSLLIKRR